MLPPALSNGACSLNAGEDKAALSAMISLSELGNITSVKLQPSIIRSRVRGVYSEVNALFDGTASKEIKAKYKPVMTQLLAAKELAELLKKNSSPSRTNSYVTLYAGTKQPSSA